MTRITAIDKLTAAPQDGVSYYLSAPVSSVQVSATNDYTTVDFKVRGYKITGNSSPVEVKNRLLVTKIYFDGTTKVTTTTAPYGFLDPNIAFEIMFRTLSSVQFYMWNDADTDIVAALNIPFVYSGTNGTNGAAGPMSYMAGEWNSTTTYERTTTLCPVVMHNGYYWYPKSTGSNTGEEPTSSSSYWKMLEDMEIIITKMLMANFGKIASAIFSGQYMFSQYGLLNGVTVDDDSEDKDTAYTQFDYSDPDNAMKFIPNLLINFLTGKLKAKNAEIEGQMSLNKISYTQMSIEDGIFKGSFITTPGNYVLPSLTADEGYVRITVFSPSTSSSTLTSDIVNLTCEGSSDRFYEMNTSGSKLLSIVDEINVSGWVEIIGMVEDGHTVWVWKGFHEDEY